MSRTATKPNTASGGTCPICHWPEVHHWPVTRCPTGMMRLAAHIHALTP